MSNKKIFTTISTFILTTTILTAEPTQKSSQKNFLSKYKTFLISASTSVATGVATLLTTYFITKNKAQNKINLLNSDELTDFKNGVALKKSEIDDINKTYEDSVQKIHLLFKNKKSENEITNEELQTAINYLEKAAINENAIKMHNLDMLAKVELAKILQSHSNYIDSIAQINALITDKNQEEAKKEALESVQDIIKKIETDENKNPYDLYYSLKDLQKERMTEKDKNKQ